MKQAEPHKRRLQQYREARAIIAVAAADPQSSKHPTAPNYYKIANALSLPKKSADLAVDIWNQANGPDEGQQTEENALDRVGDLIEMETENSDG